jgi:hypothetical protein
MGESDRVVDRNRHVDAPLVTAIEWIDDENLGC